MKLKGYAFKLYQFLMECYHVDKRSPEAFSGHYVWSYRDPYTGQKSELTLKEIVEENIKLKNLNGEEKYFKFFITFVISLFSVLVFEIISY